MEKVIEIDGKAVVFRKTGATMVAYKRQTGREFYSDLSNFLNVVEKDENGEILRDGNGNPKVKLENFTVDYMYDMLHIMARAADKSIPADIVDWLDGFNDFPVVQIFIEILPLLNNEMQISRKNLSAAAVKMQ